jgi:hypothetical protein
MKQADLLKLGDQAWVRKRKGFRIRCYQLIDDVRTEALMPTESELPMDSELAAWRVAYKLAQNRDATADGQPVYIDITVVDDLGEPVPYYVTGQPQVFNERNHD